MEKRTLGGTALQIAPFVLGGNVFGWTIGEAASFEILDAFTGGGFNCIDTADAYSTWKPGNKGGESETIIGNWLKQRSNRNAVIIATKVGSDMGEGKNLRKAYILKAADASLRRLQTDHIDLYQSHWDDPATPIEETLEAYQQLIQAGKVLAIGASNFSKERLAASLRIAAANGLPRYQSFQPAYNLYDREGFETEYQQFCLDENIGVICYYGLASGFLTGKYRTAADFSKSARGGGMQKYMNPKGEALLAALDEAAAHLQVSPATIALAWLMSRPGITAPIASATSVAQLQELMKAAAVYKDVAGSFRLPAA